jgi:hypothetical protein
MALYPGQSPEAYVEGRVTRLGKLSREHHGPRAILNAVERIIGGYEAEHDRATRDVHIAQGQLRDYAARQDGAFAHTAYLEKLTGLRNELDAALSTTKEAHDTGALVERFKALKAVHTLEVVPERATQRKPQRWKLR